ncbi:unnamed protein product [Ascophyllum nodosum]
MVNENNERHPRGKQDQRTARHHAARGGRGGSVGHDRRRTEGGGRGASTPRSPLPLSAFVMRDREPRHQHDMRAFVMAARIHAETGRLSEAIAWLGDTSKFGVSRVMDVCRASTTGLSADAGNTKGCVSFQVRKLFKPVRHAGLATLYSSSFFGLATYPGCETKTETTIFLSTSLLVHRTRVFLPLVDLAVSTEFRNSALRTETNVLFSTLYKVEGTEGLWGRVLDEFRKLAMRGSLRDTSYMEHDRRRDGEGHGFWEPSTWADVALPLARFITEVTKRFRDAVLADKDFQEWASNTLPAIVALWKVICKGGAASPPRSRELEVEDAMNNLNRVMGAALHILRRSEEAKAARDKSRDETASRSELFNLPNRQTKMGCDVGGGYDGPGRFSRLGVRRHDNDGERIFEISIPPTAGEILCERPPYVPRNAPSTWDNMEHLQPLRAGTASAIMDVHFRLLRQDFVEPLREAVLGYRREQKDKDGRSGDRAGVFKAKTEGGRSFLSLFVFKNIRVMGVTGTSRSGVCVWLEFDKPEAVRKLSHAKQKDYWERAGRLAVANMVVLCEDIDSGTGSSVEGEREGAVDPLLVFAVISERDVQDLSKGGQRGKIGVTFDGSIETVSCIERMLGCGGLSGDGRLLMLQPSNSYFAYRPILRVLKSSAREVIPFVDILLPPAKGATIDPTVAVRPPRYLLSADSYNLTDIVTTAGEQTPPSRALSSVNMLDPARFPIAELLEKTTLDEAQLTALLAALSREVTLI